jgi:hypothetical protein
MDSADGILVRLDYRPKVGWWLAGRQAGPHKQVANQTQRGQRVRSSIVQFPWAFSFHHLSPAAAGYFYFFIIFRLFDEYACRQRHTYKYRLHNVLSSAKFGAHSNVRKRRP